MEKKKRSKKLCLKYEIRPVVILVPVLIFLTLIIIGITNGDSFIAGLNSFFVTLMVNGSWLVGLGTLSFVAFLIFIMIHPIGSIRLGGENAKPEYSRWNWFAISLCAGIGTGIVFWGAVEPLRFAVEPQLSTGITGGTREAVIWSLSKSYLHWSFAPYATYAIFGVAIAYAYYNMNKSFSVSSGFAPLLGNRAEHPWFKGFIDTLTVFALTGGGGWFPGIRPFANQQRIEYCFWNSATNIGVYNYMCCYCSYL